MKYRIVYLLFIAVIFSACSIFQGGSFPGTWKMTWIGNTTNVEWDFVVEEDNSFEYEHVFSSQEKNSVPISYKGNISEDGKVDGKIYYNGNPVGPLTGTCDYEKGEGKWRAGELSGTWSMVKME
jgi:hypothetical protein